MIYNNTSFIHSSYNITITKFSIKIFLHTFYIWLQYTEMNVSFITFLSMIQLLLFNSICMIKGRVRLWNICIGFLAFHKYNTRYKDTLFFLAL